MHSHSVPFCFPFRNVLRRIESVKLRGISLSSGLHKHSHIINRVQTAVSIFQIQNLEQFRGASDVFSAFQYVLQIVFYFFSVTSSDLLKITKL